MIAGVFGLTVAAIDRPWALLPLSGGVAALNLALDLALIPRYGALGAAFANSAAQIGFALAAWLIVRRVTGARLPAPPLLAIPLLGALVAFGLPRLLMAQLPGVGGLLLAIAAAALAYAAGVVLLAPRLPGFETLGRWLPGRRNAGDA